MKKVILIIFVFILCFGYLSSINNSYANSQESILGKNVSTATLLTEQISYPTLIPTPDFSTGYEMYYNEYTYFKFIPKESGDYKLAILGSEDPKYCTYFAIDVFDENNIYILSGEFEFNNEQTKVINVEAGKTYYINICISTKNTTYYSIAFDRLLIDPSAGFSLTYSAGTGGCITGDTTQIVLSGLSGTEVTAVPDSGYEFSQWSDGITTPSRTDKNVTEDINVIAEFNLGICTIDPIEDMELKNSLESNLPKATVRDENGNIVTGKKVLYTCDDLSDYAKFFSSDRSVVFNESTPVGTYTVTVSLEDNSAEPITFDINFKKVTYSIEFSEDSVNLVKGNDLYFDLPEVSVIDSEGSNVDAECAPTGSDFDDYILDVTDLGVSIKIDIPIGTYHLTYSVLDTSLTSDFIIIVRNPRINYTAGTGGSITGETSQTIEPGANGTIVTAEPDEDYVFVKWCDGDTNASRRENNVTGDINVTAEFVQTVAVNIDASSTGDTLRDKVETVLNGIPCIAIKTLNITAGELTDDDVLWFTTNLTQIETLSITGGASFTDDTLPDRAFKDLGKLKSVTIDLDATESLSFGNYAFHYCRSLEVANLPQAVTFGVAAFQNNYKLNNVILPNAKSFGGNSFNECQALTEISLPNTETVGTASFVHCISLESVDLSKIEVVKDQMFTSSKKLISVNLSNVKEFGVCIFWSCKKPIEMTLGSVPPTVIFDSEQPYSGTFGQYLYEESSKILIPSDDLEAYKSTDGWDNGSWCGWPVETYSNASSDNTLSDLTVDNVTIPSFDSEKNTYNIENASKSSIDIGAISNDSNAEVT